MSKRNLLVVASLLSIAFVVAYFATTDHTAANLNDDLNDDSAKKKKEPMPGYADACLMLAKSLKCQELYADLNDESVAPMYDDYGNPYAYTLTQGVGACQTSGGCPNDNAPWVISCCCGYPSDKPRTNYCCTNTTCGV